MATTRKQPAGHTDPIDSGKRRRFEAPPPSRERRTRATRVSPGGEMGVPPAGRRTDRCPSSHGERPTHSRPSPRPAPTGHQLHPGRRWPIQERCPGSDSWAGERSEWCCVEPGFLVQVVFPRARRRRPVQPDTKCAQLDGQDQAGTWTFAASQRDVIASFALVPNRGHGFTI